MKYQLSGNKKQITMKRNLILLILAMLFLHPYVYSQDNKEIHDFTTDLASANVKLRGKLQLFGDYKSDLSSLKFEQYIKLLEENETESNEGLSEIISEADNHLFKAKKNTFLIAIYSKELNILVFDDANTSMIDSVKILNKNQIPDFKKFTLRAGL